MRVPGVLRRRRALVAGAVVAVVALVAVVLVVSDDGDERLVASEEGTTTTDAPTTTTTEAGSTTTSTATTTTAPTTTTTAPPPTAPPPTAPPTTVPASLDRLAVLAYAKASWPGVAAPYMYSGSTCEVGSGRHYDQGDDSDGDITSAELVRDCAGTYRLFLGSTTEVPTWDWVEIDAAAGGCAGVDVVAAMWAHGPSVRGSVVVTPTCDPSSWSAPGTTGNPAFPGSLIDFSGSHFGDPPSFSWRVGVLGSAGDTTIDLVPNSGFAAFQR